MQSIIILFSLVIQFFILVVDGKSNLFLRSHTLDEGNEGNENAEIAYEYTPSDYVHYGHGFTHSTFSYDTAYFYQISIIPAIVLGVGTFVLVFLFFSSLKCCKYSICRSYANPKSVFFEADMTCVTMFYLLFTLFTIAMTQVIFNLGNVLVDRSGPLLSTQFEAIGKNFTSSNVIVVDLTGNSLLDQYNAALQSCDSPLIQGYTDNITYFSSSLNNLGSSSHVVTTELNTVTDYLDSYFDSSTNFNYSSLVMYFTWILPLCVGVLHFVARHFFRVDVEDVSSTFMKSLFACSSLSFLYCLFLGVLLFLLIIGGGDFCMDPSTVLANDLPLKDLSASPSVLVNISAYYSSCNAYKPSYLQIYGTNSYNSLIPLSETVDFLLTSPAIPHINCPSDPNVQEMQQSLNEIFVGLETVNEQLGCIPMQSLYLTDVIFKSLCTDFYEGSFWIWASLLVLAFLHLCLISISIFFWDSQVALAKEAEEEEEKEAATAAATAAAARKAARKNAKDDDGDDDEEKGGGIRRGSIVLPKKSKVSPASTTTADNKKVPKDKKQLHKERKERRETRHQKQAEAHGRTHHHHHRKVVPVKDANGNVVNDEGGKKQKKHAINRISFGVERLSHLVTKGSASFLSSGKSNASSTILKNIKKSKINFLNNLFKTTNNEFPKIGIKLSYLVQTFIPKYLKGKGKDGKQQLLSSMSTADVCSKIIKKVSRKTSFVEYLFRKERNIDDLDIATVYICHTWKYSFLDVINTLVHYFSSSVDASNHTNLDVFVWFDLFCMNQHSSTASTRFPAWWSGTFPQGIREVGHTIVIASPWEHPLLLTRTWCLFELYLTLSNQTTKLDFIISEEQEQNVAYLVTKGKKNELEVIIKNMLSSISFEKSEVSHEEDKIKILEVLRNVEGGIEAVEEILKKGVREAILHNALRIVDQQEKKIDQD
jgi:hypothetical protein